MVTLPGGLIDSKGQVQREAELADLTGKEEELLASHLGGARAVLETTVLSRCVRRIGHLTPLTEDLARDLLVGDRQYLLLRLREQSFGERIDGELTCPWKGCGAPVAIDFTTKDVPVVPGAPAASAHRLRLTPESSIPAPDGSRERELIFRLPNGGDQEALGTELASPDANASGVLGKLLCRCILGTSSGWEEAEDIVDRMSPRARMELEREMLRLSPALELDMQVGCPTCGRNFVVPFDLSDFFFGELRTTQDLLYRQVHYLAYHYHWSEQEILEMPRAKRETYIDILADEIEALDNAS